MTAVICSQCYGAITGRVIHDEGIPWCEPCRQSHIEHRAETRARIALRRGVEFARDLAELQSRSTTRRKAA